MPSSVMIIGGGVVGLSSAWYLHHAGYQVTVLDQGDMLSSCSTGNAGYICPSHVVPLAAPGMVAKGLKMMLDPKAPFYIRPRMNTELWRWTWLFMRHANHRHLMASREALASLSLMSQHAREEIGMITGIQADYAKRGLLMACQTKGHLAQEIEESEHAVAVGMDVQILTQDDIRAMDPALEMDLVGGVLYPGDTHIHPGRWMGGLREALLGEGVQIIPNTTVTGLLTRGNQIVGVHTSAGEMEAGEVVLCGGAWSGELLKKQGFRLPMQGAKGYSFTLDNPPVLPKFPFILADYKVAVTPMGNQLRFAGTLELAGLDPSMNQQRLDRILEVVQKSIPAYRDYDFSGIQPWAGFRPCSPDGLPYIGRWPGLAGLTIATGHAMLGMTLGAGTGQLVAELLTGSEPRLSLAPFRPDRFR
ncbi:MAG: FAD-dependent oxidoreductase [Saprospiraceae bacterium]|nr:FAD-dependent oxidoreductase [Saprospiraceae bacterium]